MRKKIKIEVGVPEGIEANVAGGMVEVKGKEGSIKKNFSTGKIDMKKIGGNIVLESNAATKREKKQMHTIRAHLKNMIQGVEDKFEYKLKICYSHFPFTVEVKGNEASIKNFLGEKNPRKITIPSGAEINTDKEYITIKSVDKELAGQIAANFEKLARVRSRDRRVFQDGIFMVNKAGKSI